MTKNCFSLLVFLMILFFNCGGKKEKDNIISSENLNEVNNLLSEIVAKFEECEEFQYSFVDCLGLSANMISVKYLSKCEKILFE